MCLLIHRFTALHSHPAYAAGEFCSCSSKKCVNHRIDRSGLMRPGCTSEQLRFLETNVIKGEKRIVDVSVSDPSIKVWNVNSTKELYKNN